MSLADHVRGDTQVAVAFTGALERALGNDTLLTVGTHRDVIGDIFGDEHVRGVVMIAEEPSGVTHEIAVVAIDRFALALEGAASDELLLSTTGPALEAAAQQLSSLSGVDLELHQAEETDAAQISELVGDGDLVVYPILDGTDAVACLVIAVGTSTPSASAPGAGTAADPEETVTLAIGAPLVLADVEMGVTAELGRCNMTIRELLSLTPGAVIDLDRAAGAPVDVLVNGTRIARGEVVVIDEEFGIRISEILRNGAPRV